MRILGLDYGTRTVGVAVSDVLGLTAQAVETITRKETNKLRKTLARIEQLIGSYGVERIVLGYPKHMNNSQGDRCAETERFRAHLMQRTGLEVILWDERMSTAAAEKILIEGQVRREHRKAYVDQLAAVFILQGYLDSLQFERRK